VTSSGAHLKELFRQTSSLEDHVAHVRKLRSSFDLDNDRIYATLDAQSGVFLGETGLIKRAGIDALEIAYWLRADATGKGIATEMAMAMVKTAFEFDTVQRLDLCCAPGNERSIAVARRLGFTFEARLRDRQMAVHHTRGDLLVFSMVSLEYERSAAHALDVRAEDFLDRPLLPRSASRDGAS
jgi:RimJ/RimL family protein N-acetyltransferase